MGLFDFFKKKDTSAAPTPQVNNPAAPAGDTTSPLGGAPSSDPTAAVGSTATDASVQVGVPGVSTPLGGADSGSGAYGAGTVAGGDTPVGGLAPSGDQANKVIDGIKDNSGQGTTPPPAAPQQ